MCQGNFLNIQPPTFYSQGKFLLPNKPGGQGEMLPSQCQLHESVCSVFLSGCNSSTTRHKQPQALKAPLTSVLITPSTVNLKPPTAPRFSNYKTSHSVQCIRVESWVIKVCDLSWLPQLSRLRGSGLVTASIQLQGRLNEGTMIHKLIHRTKLLSLGSQKEERGVVNKNCPT